MTRTLAPVVQLRRATPVPVPQPPTYDVDLLARAHRAAMEIVRELSFHRTEAALAEGVRPADPRAAQARLRALDLARRVLAVQESRRGRPPY